MWPFNKRKIVIEDLKRIDLLPDDIIVLTVKQQLSEENVKYFTDNLKRIFGERRVLILDNGIDITLYNSITSVRRASRKEAQSLPSVAP